MAINSEQTKGLVQLREKFVSERKPIADFEQGTIHSKLDLLTVSDLRYLANFPSLVRHSIVDLELTSEQLADETSPVFDLVKASKKASQAADILEERFWKYLKAFDDELKSGFRLESIWDEPKYKTMAAHAGLDLKFVTLKFLSGFNPKEEAQKIKDEVISHFGFDELAKMYEPGGPALKLDRLIEASDRSPDGPNPVLFEAIAAQIVDDYSMSNWGANGFVKEGNVVLKMTPEKPGKLELKANEMALVEIGINKEKFTLSNETEEYFPNQPDVRYPPFAFTPALFKLKIQRQMSGLQNKELKFMVEADVHQSIAVYVAKYGKVINKP